MDRVVESIMNTIDVVPTSADMQQDCVVAAPASTNMEWELEVDIDTTD